MRAGTTTLYYDLVDHPQVAMTQVKEPNFFAFDENRTDLPLTSEAIHRLRENSVLETLAYQRLFQGSHDALATGDVSPAYLYSSLAARQMRSAFHDLQVIAILRNPVDRAYSAYLRRASVDPDPAAFVDVAEHEHRDLAQGKALPHYPLILGGLYSQHLASYLELFTPSQRMICIYETFWSTYPSSLGEIHEFIGVSSTPPSSNRSLNRSGVPRWPWLDRFLRSGSKVKTVAKRHLPSRAIDVLVASKQAVEDWTLLESPGLPESARMYLLETYFADDIEHVEDMLDRDLSVWIP